VRLLTTIVHGLICLSLVGCGGRATRGGPAPAADFPLPPLSPTVIGALIAEADRLGLDDAQRGSLFELDDGLRARYAATEAELNELREQRRPRLAPSGSGGPGGGGMRGGGGGGGPGGGGPGGGGGMRGGGGGGRGGPPPGAAPRAPAPVDPDAQRLARDRADALLDERDRDQRTSAERALDLMRDTQLDAARAIIDDYFARAAAPPRALPPVGGGERPPGGGER